MVSTLHPVSLAEMPLALKQWPQWDCRAIASVQYIFKASLAQHIIESDQDRTSWKLHGVWSSPVCRCWGSNWSLWRSAHSIWLCPSVFLPFSRLWPRKDITKGTWLPRLAPPHCSGRVGGQDYSSCSFPSLPGRKTSQHYSFPATVGCLNMGFLQRGDFYRCTLSCGRTVQVTTTF